MSPSRIINGCLSLILLATVNAGYGQSAPVTVADIEKMLTAKISEAVIVARVRQAGVPVPLSIDEIIALKQLGASDNLIETALKPTQAATGNEVSSPAEKRLEMGVYARRAEAWIELEPELVSIKQSSAFKVYTGGIETNGYITAASSKTTLKTPIDVMLVTSEGVSASEYQLVKLRSSSKGTAREFRVGKAGFTGGNSGVDRDKIAIDFKKIGPRQFTVTLPSSVVAGEYAFLPPMAAGGGNFGQIASGGKAYTFRVLE